MLVDKGQERNTTIRMEVRNRSEIASWRRRDVKRERKENSEKVSAEERERMYVYVYVFEERGEKKTEKSAYMPVNYCLACSMRYMRVRAVSITGLKELTMCWGQTKAII